MQLSIMQRLTFAVKNVTILLYKLFYALVIIAPRQS